MRYFVHITVTLVLWVGLRTCAGQVSVLSQKEVIDLVLKNHPALRAAAFRTEAAQKQHGAAVDLADPELLIESPTGSFMTLGVSQSVSIPTVYSRQAQFARLASQKAGQQQRITESEVRRQAKNAYMQLQIASETYRLWQVRDSIYTAMAVAAERSFVAGTIDYVTSSFAAVQKDRAETGFWQAKSDLAVAYQQLALLTGMNDSLAVEPIGKSSQTALPSLLLSNDSSLNSPIMQDYMLGRDLAEKSLQVERNKALPAFTIGYLNPGGSEVPLEMRMRYGISLPLWYWKQHARVSAAKSGLKASENELQDQLLQLQLSISESRNTVARDLDILNRYESSGLSRSEALAAASARMYKAGEISLIEYLRIVDEVLTVKERYLEVLQEFHISLNNLTYLSGE